MARSRILLFVLAGGAGGRLDLLTDHRAKPAVPFGGAYRLIDFPLSNAHHSGIDDVWVVQQFHPVSIADHLANGRPWDLDRTDGGLLLLHPHQGDEREGWHQGTADALWRQAPLIRDYDPEHLVVVSADAVYTLDYRSVVEAHAASGADVTMVTTRRPLEEAGRYGVVQASADGRIVDYAYKPDEPASDVVTTEVFVFTPGRLLSVLEDLADDGGLEDLGHAALPRLVKDGDAREFRMSGYWRDVGTVPAYLDAHLELASPEPPLRLDDPAWPILTANPVLGSAFVAADAALADAVLGPSARVGGVVRRSVVSAGAVVEAGAFVEDSVLLPGAVVRSGARVTRSIVDSSATVGAGAVLGAPGGEPVLVGWRASVPPGTTLEPGARFS